MFGLSKSASLAVVVCLSCGGDDEPVLLEAAACPDGMQPKLEQCEYGARWAECGGSGEPLLACGSPSSDSWTECLWFSGGCVAAGYVASKCPHDDVCCIDDWPYPAALCCEFDTALTWLLTDAGLEPWARDRGMVVSVDELTESVAESFLDCSGVPDWVAGDPICERAPLVFANRRAVTTEIYVAGDFGGVVYWFDVDLAGRKAVVCERPVSDVGVAECSQVPVAVCADSGAVLVRQTETNVEMMFDVSIPAAQPYVLRGAVVVPLE